MQAPGLGRFTFAATGALRVAVPANAYARTYHSELSVSVTSGCRVTSSLRCRPGCSLRSRRGRTVTGVVVALVLPV